MTRCVSGENAYQYYINLSTQRELPIQNCGVTSKLEACDKPEAIHGMVW